MRRGARDFRCLLLLLLLGACAARPDSIAAASVDGFQYQGWTCPQLASEQARIDRTLAALYSEQSQSRTDDVLGYIFTLRPLASMSGGDLWRQISLVKGERDALRYRLVGQCSLARS